MKFVKAGHYNSKNAVKNSFFESYLDTSDEWIVQRTGIETRYWEDSDVKDMSVESVKKLNLTSGEIEKVKVIIVATLSQDYIMPSISSIIQREFQFGEDVFALDINMACTGFVGGAIVAHQMLREGEYALIVGAEKLSKLVDKGDRSTVMLFGDGAGAVLFEKNLKPFYYDNGTMGSDDLKLLRGDDEKIYMHGQNIYKFALDIVPKSLKNILEKSSTKPEEIDYFVLHQANLRIIKAVSKKIGGLEKYYTNLQRYGNTSSASVPICLGEMYEKEMFREGQKMLLFGFGGGLTFAGAIVDV
ncbi:3-oxoacyl-ACP synthase III family protein [Anaerosphaera multitolerans]|uniref:3-oxoacyl-ACP synthase III family protein n=1 Tax=Anaerosphaera multitolerans TaxID=2487351 RepID=UPI0013E3AA1B|nr:beta-ketoacyl-ACP synthase 3 [Anaerosphaera multitolerans]